MTCTSPVKPNNRELLAYLDGEADSQVVDHIEQCAHCRDEVRRLSHFQDLLTTQLYRFTCPTPDELGDYHLNVLPPERITAVSMHLAKCPRCAQEITQLKNYLSALASTLESDRIERVKNRVNVLVARLADGGSESGLAWRSTLGTVGMAVRGADDGPSLYDADDVQIAVEVQDDAERPGRKIILGLVIGAEADGLTAHLWRVEQPIAIVPVDELGNFCFPNLPRGNYELVLSSSEAEIHIQGLEIGTQ